MFNLYDFKFSVIFTSVATTLSYVFGGFDELITTLLMFVIIDIVTGGAVAFFVTKNWKSEEMRIGLMRKCFMFIFILIAVRLDLLLDTNIIRTAVMFFYIANECLSILENFSKMGVPFPQFIKERMEEMKDNNDKGEVNHE